MQVDEVGELLPYFEKYWKKVEQERIGRWMVDKIRDAII